MAELKSIPTQKILKVELKSISVLGITFILAGSIKTAKVPIYDQQFSVFSEKKKFWHSRAPESFLNISQTRG